MSDTTCPDCSAAVAATDRFCGQCGAKLTLTLTDTASPEAAPSEAAPPAHDSDDWTRLVDAPAPAPAPKTEVGGSATIAPPMSEFAELEAAARADADVVTDFPEDDQHVPPRRRWVGPALFALAAAAVAGGVWWTSADRNPTAQLAPEDELTPEDERLAWQAAYRDEFVSDTLTLLANRPAERRDYPSGTFASVQSTLEEGTEVTGRWVRGHDGQSKWLRLADGGYVAEADLIAPDAVGAPILIPFSNRDSGFGPAIASYIEVASAQARARYARIDALPPDERDKALAQLDETQSTYVRVPNRRFHGLTVTAVAVHYEASGIIFREPVATVMRVFRERGLRVSNDGAVPLPADAAESCSFTSTADWPETAAYGATQLVCGV